MPPALVQNPVLRSLLWWFVVFLVVLLPLSSVVLAWRMILPPSDCGQSATATRSGSVEYFCFPLLRPRCGQGTITAGADGNLWFTEERKIARVTPSGVLTEFSAEFPSGPIITGPDRSIWFTEMAPQGGYKLVRMSVRGEREVFAENQLDTSSALLVGPDGNLWIGEARSITKVSPTGEVSTFSLPSPSQVVPGADHGFGIMALTSGADGNLWFSTGVGKIGRVTPSGVVTLFPLSPQARIGGLASGPDGRIWFLRADNTLSGSIWWVQLGRITL